MHVLQSVAKPSTQLRQKQNVNTINGRRTLGSCGRFRSGLDTSVGEEYTFPIRDYRKASDKCRESRLLYYHRFLASRDISRTKKQKDTRHAYVRYRLTLHM